MCQARVFLVGPNGQEEEIMQDVISLEVTPEGIYLKNFFDEPRTIRGTITKIDFLKHKVFIQAQEES